MEMIFLVLALGAGLQVAKVREQQQRIRLLGRYLQPYRIERLMETLLDGYLRALGEDDPARRDQIWALLTTAETELRDQVRQLAADVEQIWPDDALVSTLPIALPRAHKLFPRATFDLRRALAIHAAGIEAVVANQAGLARRDQAYMLSAEMLLLQHTCHWFCRSRTVATARMLARHKTDHAQLVQAVSPQTRDAYRRLIGR
ncbi:hypothetical protein A9O67_08535 [Tepidimonas fonticaldi]|uniref:Uncharacterized protein n=1 Tax=Tepidimonas fonticaldi TaxID=1101373 RepID=A0A1A6DSW6_9BURK|nr:hypothetical protein [Tepidimonas fonticaldi]OBS29869.1 hypothetical protein A9O67_08535 [Tepidimonas fonticaldi]